VCSSDLVFLQAMEERVHIGDYLFVHAGIRPGVPIAEQTGSDMRWIRGEFLQDRSVREFMVVHGHTIVDEPEFTPNRIGLDTGAFQSGRLTAIGLEGTRQWLVTVSDNDPSGIS
jgi:serine/threonine protein phosphatase 1